MAFADADKADALKMMTAAANLEDSVDKHPVTPGAVLPARELLGDMLLMLEKPAEALPAYEQTLKISPNRSRSLKGAIQAATVTGQKTKADQLQHQLDSVVGEAETPKG